METAIGIFASRDNAEEAVKELRERSVPEESIVFLTRSENEAKTAAKEVGDRAVVNTAKLDDQTGMAGPAPLDLALSAFEHQSGPCLESILEICQGQHLDSSVDAVGRGDLADTDHACSPPPGPRLRESG